MKRRSTAVRFLALFWATLQLSSPGLSAIADGNLARASASGPTTHVEATTRDGCPVVHSPDCAICRYVTHTDAALQPSAFGLQLSAQSPEPKAESRAASFLEQSLHRERAPPTA